MNNQDFVADFVAHFSGDQPTPPLLVKLAQYFAGPSGFLPGKLELTDEGEEMAVGAFAEDRAAAEHFVVFAYDRLGSAYGYWRYDDRPLDRAPLVYIDSEGADSTVVTTTLEEFLAILAIGHPRKSIFYIAGDGETQPDDDTLEYRTWLERETSIAIPTRAEGHRIVERARASHPNLLEWIEQWANARTA